MDVTAQPAAQLTASVGTLRALCVLQAITRKTRILDVSYNASNNELVRNSNSSMQQQQAETACNSTDTSQQSVAAAAARLWRGPAQMIGCLLGWTVFGGSAGKRRERVVV